jgi:hypothetical protein
MTDIEFNEFANAAWPLVTNKRSNGERARALLEAIVYYPDPDEDAVLNAEVTTLASYFTGKRGIGRFAKSIVDHIDTVNFIEQADRASQDSKQSVVDKLKNVLPNAQPSTISEDCANLLDNILRTAAGQKNVEPKQVSLFPEFDDPSKAELEYLVEESNRHCPLCGRPFFRLVGDTAIEDCECIEIVPAYLNPLDRKNLLKELGSLPEQTSVNNKILLCKDDAQDFRKHPTIEKRKQLLEKKEEGKRRLELERATDNLRLDESLSEILNSLDRLIEGNREMDIRYDPIEVKRKIRPEYASLKTTVENYVLDYYPLLKKRFDDMTRNGSLNFRKLSSTMSYCYQAMSEHESSQKVIFIKLSEWVSKQTGCTDTLACQIFVAFFIQNCEVFDEIAE